MRRLPPRFALWIIAASSVVVAVAACAAAVAVIGERIHHAATRNEGVKALDSIRDSLGGGPKKLASPK